VKRRLLVEAAGGPLAVVIAGAHLHATKLLSATGDARVVERPRSTAERPPHRGRDLGYDHPTGASAGASHHDVAPRRRIGKEQLALATGEQRFPARRWVVERTRAWLSKCRALLVRYDKHSANFLALLKLACSLLCFRRLPRLSLLR
jgi:putative transposase